MKQFNLSEFGAVGDGKFDCSASFKSAFNKIAEVGGGKLVVEFHKGDSLRTFRNVYDNPEI